MFYSSSQYCLHNACSQLTPFYQIQLLYNLQLISDKIQHSSSPDKRETFQKTENILISIKYTVDMVQKLL